MNDAKNLYGKNDNDDDASQGTTVQTITVSRPNKNGIKEPVSFIKAKRNKPIPGEEKITYYKAKRGTNPRDILDQIQQKGKPDGQDGVDYDKVKGDELPEIHKLFDENKDIPKIYYYTSKVKGNGIDKNGKPYGNGKIHFVTVLSDPNNKTNKNSPIQDVFRKAEEANEKKDKDKDNANYYYTKTLGSLLNKDALKSPQYTKVADTNMRDIYNKIKGDILNLEMVMMIYS